MPGTATDTGYSMHLLESSTSTATTPEAIAALENDECGSSRPWFRSTIAQAQRIGCRLGNGAGWHRRSDCAFWWKPVQPPLSRSTITDSSNWPITPQPSFSPREMEIC